MANTTGLGAGDKSKRSGIGGSAFLSFQNSKLAAFKRLRSPRQPLTHALRQEGQRAIQREWVDVRADLVRYQAWLDAKRGGAPGEGDNAGALEDSQFRPIWGVCDTSEQVVSHDRLVAWGQRDKARACQPLQDEGSGERPFGVLAAMDGAVPPSQGKAVQLAFRDESMVVREPVPQRTDECAGDVTKALMFGCYSNPKNVCTHVLRDGEWERLERMRTLLRRFCDNLGSERARSCNEVIMLVSDDNRFAMILLLVFAKFKPKMQLFARCEVNASQVFPPLAEFPAHAKIATMRSRLAAFGHDARLRSLHIMTSDEVSLEAIRLAFPWKLRPLKTRINCDVPSLMWFLVDGADADVLDGSHGKAVVAADRHATPREVQQALDLDLGGLASSAAASGHVVPSSSSSSGAVPAGDDLGDDAFPG